MNHSIAEVRRALEEHQVQAAAKHLREHWSLSPSATAAVALAHSLLIRTTTLSIQLPRDRHQLAWKSCLKVPQELLLVPSKAMTSCFEPLLQDFSSYLSDGLHLSAEGSRFVAAQLWARLGEKLSALPSLVPYWRDVDHTDPEASLL